MREKAEFTIVEINDILRILEENIPIKYMPAISTIGRFLNSKFEDVTGEAKGEAPNGDLNNDISAQSDTSSIG